jgi:maltose/moltooligosaccharide transporter
MPNSAGYFIAPPIMVGAGMLMIMDASFNVAMEPFRALWLPITCPIASILHWFFGANLLNRLGCYSGLCACLMYLHEWFHVSSTATAGHRTR